MRWQAVLALSVGLVIAASAVAGAAESTFDVVKKRNALVAGVRVDFPPWGYVDKNGEIAGFEIDLARAFARKLGVELKAVQTNSRTRIQMLQNGTIDIIFATTTITRKRLEVIDFSIPTVWTGHTLLVKRGSGIKSLADLGPPKVLGTVHGSNIENFVFKVRPDAKFIYFQEYPQVLMALKQGKVDALATDRTLLQNWARENPDLEVPGKDFARIPIGLGVRQNDSKFLAAVNNTLNDLWENGEFQQIYKKHFGHDPDWEMTLWPHS